MSRGWPSKWPRPRRFIEVAAEDARAITVPGRVPRAALERLDAPRQRNLLRYVLRATGLGVPSALKVDELRHALLDSRADAQPLVRWPGGEGRVYRQQLHLLPALPAQSARGQDGIVTRSAGWRGPEGEVALEPAGSAPGVPDTWLDDGLTLRFRVGGEELRPLERRHRQPLRHWFQEAGVLPWMRSRIPLLYRGGVLVAVGDLWLTADVAQVSPAEPRWRVRWTGHPPVI
jgi:tRNA(Ile)-lysidine synthase